MKKLNMNMDEDLETLGEQLYSLIYPKHQESAGKLTGMMLELPAAVLKQMLQDEAMLAAAVGKALSALQLVHKPSEVTFKDEDDASVSSDSLGEQLFELVDVYNTGQSQKITGMLLEQHKETVLHLISDPKMLEESVTLALKTLREQNMEETYVSDSSEADELDRLGEKVFSLVEKLDPLLANDITGMLLEMDSAALQQLLRDHTMLEAAVQKAKEALKTQLSSQQDVFSALK